MNKGGMIKKKTGNSRPYDPADNNKGGKKWI